MIQQELIAYLRDAKAQGHSLESVRPVLLQLGWSEQDITDSMMVASAPVAPGQKQAVPSAPAPTQKVKKKIPDYYISPLSVLLALILFASLYTLAGQTLEDIESVVAPYAGRSAFDSVAHEALVEKYNRNIPPDKLLQLETAWNRQHASDRVTHLLVVGIFSAVFWVVAFGIHFAIGSSRKYYLPLSIPFFLTAGLYLVSALFEVVSRLFEKDAQYAIYGTLVIFIIIVTVAFMLYQKRSHAEKSL